MPRSDDLPGDLGHFARRQALEIRHNSFNSDTEKLLGTLNRLIQQDQTKDGSDGQTLGHQAHRESASQTIDDTSIQYFTVSKESRERILRVLIDGTSHTIEYKVPFFDMLNWATIKLDGEIIYRTKSIPTNVNFLIPGPGQHYSANITATTHRINVISSFRLTIGGLTVYED